MKMTIELNLDNAAFDEDPLGEAARAIRSALDRVASYGVSANTMANILDLNGNDVGVINLEVDK